MKRRTSLLLLMAGLLVLFSCEKELPYDKELMSPKIVVQGILEIDSPFVIYLERTFAFNEQDPETMITGGAVVTVVNMSSGETFTLSEPADSNRYEFPFNTTANTTYQLTVTHPDYPTVTSTTTTTQPVSLISVDTASVIINYPRLRGTLEWQDPPGENYYMVRVETVGVDDTGDTIHHGIWCYSSDPAADNSLNDDPLDSGGGLTYYVFGDEQFDNTLKTFATHTSNPFQWNDDLHHTATYTLTSLNYNTYLYYKSWLIQAYSDLLFSEPSKMYTNINNGYGVFGSVSASSVLFEE